MKLLLEPAHFRFQLLISRRQVIDDFCQLLVAFWKM
jgi:hypothetical protein